jgi:hypothetical protein
MEDIKKLWNQTETEYKDMCCRMSFVEKKNKELLERKNIKDKFILLTNDLKEVIRTMEKINYSIDDVYADHGTVSVKGNTCETRTLSL